MLNTKLIVHFWERASLLPVTPKWVQMLLIKLLLAVFACTVTCSPQHGNDRNPKGENRGIKCGNLFFFNLCNPWDSIAHHETNCQCLCYHSVVQYNVIVKAECIPDKFRPSRRMYDTFYMHLNYLTLSFLRDLHHSEHRSPFIFSQVLFRWRSCEPNVSWYCNSCRHLSQSVG